MMTDQTILKIEYYLIQQTNPLQFATDSDPSWIEDRLFYFWRYAIGLELNFAGQSTASLIWIN